MNPLIIGLRANQALGWIARYRLALFKMQWKVLIISECGDIQVSNDLGS